MTQNRTVPLADKLEGDFIVRPRDMKSAAALLRQQHAALVAMVKAHEDTESNTEGRWPEADPGCIECTSGTTPNNRNTGLCGYHAARAAIKAAENES